MSTNEIGRRFALAGGVTTGVIGIVLAINVATDAGQFWQAGICLIAAAGAFGSLGFVFGKTEG